MPRPYPLGRLDVGTHGLASATLLIAFMDGFNPCSLWVLIVLIAMIMGTRSRTRIAAVGPTFLVVTAGICGLFIAGLLAALEVAAHLGWIRIAVAVLALGITVAMAAGVALMEFPCTAGFRVIWTTLVFEAGSGRTACLGLLLPLDLLTALTHAQLWPGAGGEGGTDGCARPLAGRGLHRPGVHPGHWERPGVRPGPRAGAGGPGPGGGEGRGGIDPGRWAPLLRVVLRGAQPSAVTMNTGSPSKLS